MERERPRSRRKKKLSVKTCVGFGGGVMAAAALIVSISYYHIGKQYEHVFFPNTVINGIDASKKSAEEVKNLISSGIDGYTLTISERGGRKEEIKGGDIGLQSVFDGSLERLIKEQKPMKWLKASQELKNLEVDTMIQYDDASFQEAVLGLSCFNQELMVKPENAYISDYVPGQGYRVIPPEEGSLLDKDKAKTGISEAVMNLKQELSLEELGAYVQPEIQADDHTLLSQVQTLNTYAGVTVTYDFGGEKRVLDGGTISKWLGLEEDGTVSIDSEAVFAYVKELASEYDTYNRAKSLKTSYGQTVRITGGVYGWRIDQGAEAAKLTEEIRLGQSQEREPVYRQRAASRSGPEYGNTYVEINLTAQHLFFYKDGKLVVESDFVSGNQAKGWATPAGVYSLTYKQRNAVLKGENYRTPVDYWMPFNGGIGLHDAKWRNTFGGEIYKNGGSHGCVNLPHSVAKTIYENISSGIPVLCYHLEGTQSKASQKKPEEGQGSTKPTAPEPTAPPQTQPAETEGIKPEETQPTEGENIKPEETQPAETKEGTQATEPLKPSSPEASAGNGEVGPGVSEGDRGREEIGPGVS